MICVVTRCFNEQNNIKRFVEGYDWADKIIISDGGSTDASLEMLEDYRGYNPNLDLLHFDKFEIQNEQRWNPDNPHLNFIIDAAKSYNPDWIILDDMDDVPNHLLRLGARNILENCKNAQVNAFRLYMWGETQYYPKMNNYFDPLYTSLWAWQPKLANIHCDESIRHGTFIGLSDDIFHIKLPDCLLHYSWSPETIDAKIDRYNRLDLPMIHPKDFAGELADVPEWAHP